MNKLNRNKLIRYVFKYDSLKSGYLSYPFSTGVVYRENPKLRNLNPSYEKVADFYAGKSVFITGATGFVGRVLIERLLQNCKDLEKIYILIRAKNCSNLQQRYQELLFNPVFTELTKKNPLGVKKIVPIAGDITDVRLGLSLVDEQTLIEKVSVIFHVAANVKLRSPLSELMKVNYEGPKHILELAKKIKKLNVHVHVSTSFINVKDCVEEIPYPPPSSIEDVYKVLPHHSNDSNEVRKLLGSWGNCYTLSKHMGETHVTRNHGNIPTVIVRPSIVTSVYKKPLAGYTDSWVTLTGLLTDVASGLTRIIYGDKRVVAEIIPVDYVCNFLIVAAAKSNRSRKLNIYNISTGNSYPINLGTITKMYIKESKKHDFALMPFPWVHFTKARWALPVMMFLSQIIPAFTADLLLILTGRQPRYMQLQKKAIARSKLYNPVTISFRDVKTTKARELASTLNSEDNDIFPCDPVTVNWDEYIPIYCKGVKKYMLTSKKESK